MDCCSSRPIDLTWTVVSVDQLTSHGMLFQWTNRHYMYCCSSVPINLTWTVIPVEQWTLLGMFFVCFFLNGDSVSSAKCFGEI